MNFKRRDNADLDRDLPRTKEEPDHSEQPCFSKKISTSSLSRFIFCGKLDIPFLTLLIFHPSFDLVTTKGTNNSNKDATCEK